MFVSRVRRPREATLRVDAVEPTPLLYALFHSRNPRIHPVVGLCHENRNAIHGS